MHTHKQTPPSAYKSPKDHPSLAPKIYTYHTPLTDLPATRTRGDAPNRHRSPSLSLHSLDNLHPLDDSQSEPRPLHLQADPHLLLRPLICVRVRAGPPAEVYHLVTLARHHRLSTHLFQYRSHLRNRRDRTKPKRYIPCVWTSRALPSRWGCGSDKREDEG